MNMYICIVASSVVVLLEDHIESHLTEHQAEA